MIAHIRSFLHFVVVYLSEFSWIIFLQNDKQKYTIHSPFSCNIMNLKSLNWTIYYLF